MEVDSLEANDGGGGGDGGLSREAGGPLREVGLLRPGVFVLAAFTCIW